MRYGARAASREGECLRPKCVRSSIRRDWDPHEHHTFWKLKLSPLLEDDARYRCNLDRWGSCCVGAHPTPRCRPAKTFDQGLPLLLGWGCVEGEIGRCAEASNQTSAQGSNFRSVSIEIVPSSNRMPRGPMPRAQSAAAPPGCPTPTGSCAQPPISA